MSIGKRVLVDKNNGGWKKDLFREHEGCDKNGVQYYPELGDMFHGI
jgi:hypothetical protein